MGMRYRRYRVTIGTKRGMLLALVSGATYRPPIFFLREVRTHTVLPPAPRDDRSRREVRLGSCGAGLHGTAGTARTGTNGQALERIDHCG